MSFDPMSDAFAENPYPAYARLRRLEGHHYLPELGMVLLARHDEVTKITLSPKMVRSLAGFRDEAILAAQKRKENFHDMPYHERFVQTNLLDTDGPEHFRLRKLVFGAFSGNAVSTLKEDIKRFANKTLGQLGGRTKIDFMHDVAEHIPGLVIGKFLGIVEADAPQLRAWSKRVVQYYDLDRTEEKKQLAETAVQEFHAYLVELKREREARPQDDLISRMIVEEREGHFRSDEFIATCMLVLMAGHGSTIDALGNGLHALLMHPEAISELRSNGEALPTAIEEMLRYDPPLPFFHRHALEEVTLSGKTYPVGTTFGLLYAAANRDETAFENADRFDIHRRPNRHLSFGRGAHLCLGNHLARMSLQIIFSILLERFSSIELAGEGAVFKRGLSARGPAQLHIRLMH